MQPDRDVPLARLDFTPVPRAQRRVPGRTRSVPARLLIDRWIEHRECAEYWQRAAAAHGDGSRLLVLALLHYRNTVLRPLQAVPSLASEPGSPLLIARLAFRPVPPDQRHNPARVKHVSARIYPDRWVEHREVVELLQEREDLYGEGLKTVVRALLHWRDTVGEPGRQPSTVEAALSLPSASGARTATPRQLTFDVESTP